jgi:hypothetical protein
MRIPVDFYVMVRIIFGLWLEKINIRFGQAEPLRGMSSKPAGVDFRFSGKTDLRIVSVKARDV